MSIRAHTAPLPRRQVALLHRVDAPAIGHALTLSAALTLWVEAINRADLGRISGFGLLPALPATYYVAFALLSAGFLVAVTRGAGIAWPAVYVLALVLVLHATAPLLYSDPRYAWTYKHLGVTDYIAHFGATDRSLDIYQNWPAFFALAGALERVSGVSLIVMARWAEVFFEAAYVAALVFLLRGLSRDWRIVWLSIWLFLLANWLGQDYFAPQSFAFLLYLVLIAVCVRCAPTERVAAARSRLGARWQRWLARSAAGRTPPCVDDPETVPMRPAPALVVGGLLFAVVVMSHQLSPLLAIAAVAAFAATTGRIRWRVVGAMLAVELAWVLAAWPLLVGKYDLLDFSPLERPVTTGANSAWALPGVGVQALASRASVAVVVVLALAGLWRRRRSGHWDLPLLAIILAPAVVIGVQPYSGEGVFRVYLFALPWLSFLAASTLLPVSGPRRVRGLRWLALTAAVALLGGSMLPAFFGSEIVNHVTPQDVAIERWYERNAPAGSAVLYLAPDVPNRITYRYADKQVWAASFSPALTDDPYFRGRALGVGDLPTLEAKLRGLEGTQDYVMIGPSQVAYVRATGVLPPGAVTDLITALRTSADFKLVAQYGDALLFRLTTPGGA